MSKFLFSYLFIPFLVFSLSCTKTLPILGTLPDFSLINQDQTVVQKKDLLSKVWVINFIFTSCPDVCPLLTSKMKNLAEELPTQEKLGFLSFTVDPQTDTPQRLKAYAVSHHINQKNWFFLTGSQQELNKLMNESFRVGMGGDSLMGIVHSQKFVLLDQKATIRGYYDTDKEGLDKLLSDIKLLLTPDK